MLFRFCLYGFLKNQQYYDPFLILAFRQKGLSFGMIGVLIGFRAICINLTEIPAGAVADGKCDFIALGRQLICDPYWTQKVKQSQLEKILHCKYCMTCHTAQQRGKPIRCAQKLEPDCEDRLRG